MWPGLLILYLKAPGSVSGEVMTWLPSSKTLKQNLHGFVSVAPRNNHTCLLLSNSSKVRHSPPVPPPGRGASWKHHAVCNVSDNLVCNHSILGFSLESQNISTAFRTAYDPIACGRSNDSCTHPGRRVTACRSPWRSVAACLRAATGQQGVGKKPAKVCSPASTNRVRVVIVQGSDRSQSGSAACSCKDVFAPILSSCRFNRSLLSCARTKVISRVLAAQSEAVDDNTSPNLCTQFLACMQSKAFRNWSLQRNPNSADCHKFAVQQGFNVRSVPSGLHLAPRLRFAALEACRGDRIIVGRGTRLAPTAHFDRPSLLGSTRTRSRRTQPASRCGRCGLHSLRRLCCSGPPAKSLLPLG